MEKSTFSILYCRKENGEYAYQYISVKFKKPTRLQKANKCLKTKGMKVEILMRYSIFVSVVWLHSELDPVLLKYNQLLHLMFKLYTSL